jgi:hypothetical protein
MTLVEHEPADGTPTRNEHRPTFYQRRSAHLPHLGDEHSRWITRHLPTTGRTLTVKAGHRKISI